MGCGCNGKISIFWNVVQEFTVFCLGLQRTDNDYGVIGREYAPLLLA
jgi:hypothetical protein